jgi:putative membrane protein
MDVDGMLGAERGRQPQRGEERAMWGWGWGWMWIWWVVILLAIAAVGWYAAAASRRNGGPLREEAPEQALKRRYAKGEIDRDTYQRILEDLRR